MMDEYVQWEVGSVIIFIYWLSISYDYKSLTFNIMLLLVNDNRRDQAPTRNRGELLSSTTIIQVCTDNNASIDTYI